jgi:hypothetical protein
MSVIRVCKTPLFARDHHLSYKARGLLAFIHSHEQDWEVHVDTLIKESDEDGRASVQSGMQELLRLGYATLELQRDAHGKVHGKRYVIYDTPGHQHRQTGNSPVGAQKPTNQETGFPSVGTDEPKTRQTEKWVVGDDGVNTSDDRQTGFPSDGFPDGRKTCLTKNQDLETKNKTKKETSSSFRTSAEQEGISAAVPSDHDATLSKDVSKEVLPTTPRVRPKKAILPIPTDHWLLALLDEYREHFDIDALNDWLWWKEVEKTLPKGIFTLKFTRAAFADLALWLGNNPLRRPRLPHTWRDRMKKSLNYYYDNVHVKRLNGQGKADTRQNVIANFVKGGKHDQ